MEWEQLNAQEFPGAVKQAEGLCLLPLGCIEKHGDHLPLSTDITIAYTLACAAAAREPAVVFPRQCFGDIACGRHQPGTIALDCELLLRLLENICDEIARNGFHKILVVNFHGGNQALLKFYGDLLLEKRKPYCFYYSHAWVCRPEWLPDHAGKLETSLMLHLTHEEKFAAQAGEDGAAQGRFRHLQECFLNTGADWYADYPNHLHADGTPGSAGQGAAYFQAFTDHLAKQIRVVKADTAVHAVFTEFHDRAANPQ